VRAELPNVWNDPGNVLAMDNLLDALGFPRETTRAVSKAGIDLIKQFEGCKLTAYPDPGTGGAPWTIGWGATGPDIRRGLTWTQEQADARLEADVQRFARGVDDLVEEATQSQFDALVSFAYNVGRGALASSTLLKKHRAGDYAGAAAEFARWNKAGGRVLPGLTRRRAAEAAIYRGQA
jgi:lysozyme